MFWNWLKEADLLYNDIEINKAPAQQPDHVRLNKDIYNKDGKVISNVFMDLFNDESDGTQKYYSFIGKLLNKFESGGLLISDEIDSNFHPALLRKIISLFNNPVVNKANAQLLFTQP